MRTAAIFKAIPSGRSFIEEKKAAPAFVLSSRSGHDDDQPILHEMKYSIENRLKHSIKLVRGSLNEKIKSQLKDRYLSEQESKFKEKAWEILQNNILANWNHQDEPLKRRQVLEKMLEKIKQSHLKDAKQNQDIIADINTDELASFLDKIEVEFLKPFIPLNDLHAASEKCLKKLADIEDFLKSAPAKLPKNKKLKLLRPKIMVLNQWQTLLSTELLQESSFKQLFNKKSFFTYEEQHNYEDKTFGNTPLHFCAWFNDYPSAEALIASAKNSKNNRGYLPFHFVIRKCSNPVIFLELLNPSRAELTTEDPQNMQALESAAYYGNVDALSWIIATLKRPDKNGKITKIDGLSLTKAFKIACEVEHKEINEIIKILGRELIATINMGHEEWLDFFHSIVTTTKANVAVTFFMSTAFSSFKDSDLRSLTPTQAANTLHCVSAIEQAVTGIRKKLETICHIPTEIVISPSPSQVSPSDPVSLSITVKAMR